MNDAEIAARCLAGDKQAFEVLVRKYQAPLLALSMNILGNLEEARDVSQESFFRAFLNLGDFDHGKSFKNWLYTIAVHKCIDRKRRIRNLFQKMESLGKISRPSASKFMDVPRSFDHGSAGHENESSNSGETVDPTARHYFNHEMNDLLNGLGFKDRTALVLSIIDGYSAKEIARIMNCSENTVRVHIFRAKAKLRNALKENGNALSFL